MIQTLRKRFFRIALLALTAAMLLVTAAVNLTNWINVRYELRETLEAVAELETTGPGSAEAFGKKSRHMKGLVTEARYFTVYAGADGSFTLDTLGREQELSEQDAAALIETALSSGKSSGFVGDYLYLTSGSRLVFLNCETRLDGVRRLLLFSVCACALGIAVASLFVARASRRAVRPIEENMQRQKRFITDAGHELKTPLAVIAANMDLLETELPGNPWIRSTQKQTALMGRLVEELVYLSRMEEAETPLEFRALELKPLLEEVSEPFSMLAESKGQRFELSVPDELMLEGDESSLSRLVSILCDNAVKYAPADDTIRLYAEEDGRSVCIGTENATAEPLSEENCRRLFDRFYRADPSRSKGERGGFGIGLAIAAAIAEKHGGSAEARLTENGRLRITCRFPKKHIK